MLDFDTMPHDLRLIDPNIYLLRNTKIVNSFPDIVQALLTIAGEDPSSVAVCEDGNETTFEEFVDYSSAIACAIQNRDVPDCPRVLIAIPTSNLAYTAMLLSLIHI